MDYSTNFTYLTLEGHVELEHYRYLYFIFTLTVYIMIICFNTVIISVIFKTKRLHEPMYILIAALLCNALLGSTALYPKLLIDLLSEKQTVSYKECLFQAFCIYTYAASEFTLLSTMAYDRYVSICKPLQYATLVKMTTVRKLLFLSWFLPSCEVGVGVILASQLQLCKFKLNRIYCDNYSVVKLSCKETSLNNTYGLFIFSIAVFPPVIFILYSYVRILSVCLNNSKDFRRKALQTCLPHLLIFTNFSVNASFEIINSRLESNQIPHIIAMIMSVEYLLIPPLFNPIIYGLKLQEIYNNIKKILKCQTRTHVSF
ncbi:putative gustatory receptor clone PTE03 [Pangasianodon hypophthalmus]|uniref:putative gustatory receptor clone PTE03 n=1 Tax=Pangasianodon hypophthalmus TaxID=310915 RepID=UPI000EFFE06D|nr:putative gustatory receptor clone PTE03 [Pangasianodon hypophthalmus]